MTTVQTDFKKMLIRQIHTSPRYRNHYKENREEYEQLLAEHFGHRSSKQLTITQLKQLKAYMHMERSLPHRKLASPQQLYKVNELWAVKARTPTDAALLAFATRICGRTPAQLPDLTAAEAQKVIIALDNLGGL